MRAAPSSDDELPECEPEIPVVRGNTNRKLCWERHLDLGFADKIGRQIIRKTKLGVAAVDRSNRLRPPIDRQIEVQRSQLKLLFRRIAMNQKFLLRRCGTLQVHHSVPGGPSECVLETVPTLA